MPTIHVKMHEYVRTERPDVPIEIPESPVFYFQTGIRRAVRIVPQYTTWNMEQHGKPEEIWSLKVTCVYRSFQNKVETFDVHLAALPELIDSKDQYNVARLLLDADSADVRTKERFEEDLDAVLAGIASAGTMEEPYPGCGHEPCDGVSCKACFERAALKAAGG